MGSMVWDLDCSLDMGSGGMGLGLLIRYGILWYGTGTAHLIWDLVVWDWDCSLDMLEELVIMVFSVLVFVSLEEGHADLLPVFSIQLVLCHKVIQNIV